MFSALEFSIASRYLRSKRKEGFISVISVFSLVGIMLGVATLIIVMSVMNGFRHDLMERILGINSHITLYGYENQISDYDEKILKIYDLEGVSYVNALLEGQVMVSANNQAKGGLVRGIKLSDLKNKPLILNGIQSGSIDEMQGKSNIVIGVNLANNLGVRVGDKVKLIAPETNETMFGSIPRMKSYKIVAIFESGMFEYDSSTIFMPLHAAQLHFKYYDSISAIEVMADDMSLVKNTANLIRQGLVTDTLFDQPTTLGVVDWQQANKSFMSALKVERTVMFIILTLIILVAAFNIISSLIMLVNDKNKSIALLRTLGASKASIMRIFLLCGSFIGVIGTFLGVSIGVIFSLNIQNIKEFLENVIGVDLFNPAIYFLSNLPSDLYFWDVFLITLMSLALAFAATIYPSYKASKASPAEILRYE